MLLPEGLVIFTMMGSKNYYYDKIKNENILHQSGMSRVILGGRLEEESYINFVEDEKGLIQKFNMFEKVFVGYYDFYMEEGSSFHYYFIGKKVEK